MNTDWSTINLARLKALPVYTLPRTYRLQDEPGNACVGDPPGYPTYFTYSVYTQYGNSPARGPQMVIKLANGALHVVEHYDDWNGCKDWDEFHAKIWKRLHSLWNPLPIDHPRTRAWIISNYQHYRHCYHAPENLGDNWHGTMVICPVPHYELSPVVLDEHWTEEYKALKRAEVEGCNCMVTEKAARVATPENHDAVHLIRRYYPDYQPELDLIENPPEHYPGDWWEREAVRPTPAQCQPSKWFGKHRTEGWCQYCGWYEGEE